ncbi:MAG TPA: histidine kinase N-terminal 7TM domain-containing protein, partial [Rectinemataceae bacterium]
MLFFRLLLLASVVVYLFLAILFIIKKTRLSLLFSLACISVLIYSAGYSFELGSSGIEEIRFWLKIEYFGLALVPGLWFIFAFNINVRKEPDPLLTWVVLIPAFLTIVATSTNEFHHLYYRDITFLAVDGALVAQLRKGPLYYCFIAYSTILIFLTLWLFFRQWKKSGSGFRSGSFRLFLASLSVLGFQGVYLLGFSPYNIDLTSLGFIFASIAAAFAVFDNDFLKADELVKSVVFSGISEGIIVVDAKGRISDYNKAGGRLFPWLNPDSLGSNLRDSKQGEALENAARAGRTLVVAEETRKRYFEAAVQDLGEGLKVLGKVYVVKDVTAIRRVLRRLYHLANFDTLTKVFNRRRFFNEAAKE